MALSPPTAEQKLLKRIYLSSFILLAFLGFSANLWQRKRDKDTQTTLQRNQTDAEIRFSADLQAVKRSSDAILSFVTNPPKGVSPEQAIAFAKALAIKREAAPKFENISNARVADMARAIAINLHGLAERWRSDDHNEYLKIWEPLYGANPTSELRAAAPGLWAAKHKSVTEDYLPRAKQLTAQANECRLEILSRLLRSQKFEQDKTAKALYEKILGSGEVSPNDLDAAASYLDDLWKRLP